MVNKLDGKPGEPLEKQEVVVLDEKASSLNDSVEEVEVGIETKVGA